MRYPDHYPPTALGRIVRFWRTTFGVSQEELALELEASTRHISRLENGHVHPSRDMLLRISGILGLQKRDTSNMLVAAGYLPEALSHNIRDNEFGWFRKTMATQLRALDPFPTMMTDDRNGVLMCNKSWLGLFQHHLDLTRDLRLGDYVEVVMRAIAVRANEAQKETLMCGLNLTLKQEALMKNDMYLAEIADKLAEEFDLPDNWPIKGAKFEPRMSFPVHFEIDGKMQEFDHVCSSTSSMGPLVHALEPELVVIGLSPRDSDLDLSSLLDHDVDHPTLYTHEIR